VQTTVAGQESESKELNVTSFVIPFRRPNRKKSRSPIEKNKEKQPTPCKQSEHCRNKKKSRTGNKLKRKKGIPAQATERHKQREAESTKRETGEEEKEYNRRENGPVIRSYLTKSRVWEQKCEIGIFQPRFRTFSILGKLAASGKRDRCEKRDS